MTRIPITDATGRQVSWFDDKSAIYFDSRHAPGRGLLIHASTGRWIRCRVEGYGTDAETEVFRFTSADEARAILMASDGTDRTYAAPLVGLSLLDQQRPAPVRQVGRPRKGTEVKTKLNDDILSALEEWAASEEIDRSEAVARLIAKGLGL